MISPSAPSPPASEERLLVLGAHPDDETLAAAGSIQRALGAGAAVRVVLATDGDNAPWIQRVFERRWRIRAEDRARFGKLRRRETLAAAAELGLDAADVRFLGFPDQGLTPALLAGDVEPAEALLSELVDFEPTRVVAPALADLHPDHSALAVHLRRALDRLPRSGPAPHLQEVFVHVRGTPATAQSAVELALTSEEEARKHAAIERYASQLSVHRRRYLAQAVQPERYYEPDEPGAARPPLAAATERADVLRLRFEPRARLGAWGRSSLLLCLQSADGGLRTHRVHLPRRAASVAVGAGPEAPRVLVARERGGLTVDLPLGLFAGVRRSFVKLQRAHGFFDEAGWIELAVPEPAFELPRPAAAPAARAEAAPRVCVLVPCYDVVGLCGPVVRAAAERAEWVLAVDDGSSDGTGDELRAAAEASDGRVRVLGFPENHGKGCALMLGFREALEHLPFDVLVTMDGDGQHRAADVRPLAAACAAGAELVIGSREDLAAMPLRSHLGNRLTRGVLHGFYSAAPLDTQSGFRAHSRAFVREIVASVPGQRYETEMRILLLALQRGYPLASVPIPTLYLPGNRSSHFQPIADSVRIYSTLLASGLPGWLRRTRGNGAGARNGRKR